MNSSRAAAPKTPSKRNSSSKISHVLRVAHNLGDETHQDNEDDDDITPQLPEHGNIYLGDRDAAADRCLLDQYKITHLLNLAGQEELFAREIQYWSISVEDEPSADISKHFDICREYINYATKRGNVLVYCVAGISRSPCVVMAYLMQQFCGFSLQDATNFVERKRGVSCPNPGFAEQLRTFEKKLKQDRVEFR